MLKVMHASELSAAQSYRPHAEGKSNTSVRPTPLPTSDQAECKLLTPLLLSVSWETDLPGYQKVS